MPLEDILVEPAQALAREGFPLHEGLVHQPGFGFRGQLPAVCPRADVLDGATIMIGGFGNAGMPSMLIDALIEQGAGDLRIVCNNAGSGDGGLAALLKAGRVRKIICCSALSPIPTHSMLSIVPEKSSWN